LTRTIDLLAIEIYEAVAALSVESFCSARWECVESALTEKSTAISARMDAEARLADQQIQLGLIRNSEARLRAAFDNAASESHAVATATGSG
jgi:hypothetical protein